MDIPSANALPAQVAVPSSDPVPSSAPLSSGLSDPPATDLAGVSSQPTRGLEEATERTPQDAPEVPAPSGETVSRTNANAATTVPTEAAVDHIMTDFPAAEVVSNPDVVDDSSVAIAAAAGRAELLANITVSGSASTVKMEGDASAIPGPSVRGSTRGRPRGRGRGGGRGGKRKREDKDDGDSDSSEIYTPVATKTKSGRSIQKPTAFVPPPEPSPSSSNKRKRPYRRNPESAVCKVCLRGTSPASNMIVFCDGCNTPYHRYCHHPPIDQSVVDEVDKEWFCKQCESERVVPVPEAEVAEFIAANGASAEQRQKYFASLPQGMLVTLLTRATTLKPDLPLFAKDFQSGATTNGAGNGHAHHAPASSTTHTQSAFQAPRTASMTPGSMLAGPNSTNNATAGAEHVPDEHPPNYPRPGYGLMKTLPPEQEDLQWLVDDDDRYGVFTHMYQVDPNAANAGINGGQS